MITAGFWKSWLAFWLVSGPALLGAAGLLFTLYLSHRHLDAMMGALKNSRYIYLWGPAWRRQGWIGGVVLIVKIAGLVVFPRAYIIKGDVHPGDIADFPPRLKRLLIIKVAMTLIVVVWMVIAAVLIQFK